MGYDGNVSYVFAAFHESYYASLGGWDKTVCRVSCVMEHLSVADFLLVLVVMLGVGKLAGALAQRAGQPAVLGELIGGVLVGKSVLGLVDAGSEAIQLMSELGVVILLFAIGLETDLGRLLKVGATSLVVAIVGVIVPFVLGFAACRLLGLTNLVSIMAGATLTATSVGITARVLGDLGRLHDEEGQIILGAAVLDDVLGLVVLTVVAGLAEGREITWGGTLLTTVAAIGFLAATLIIGRLVVPRVSHWARRLALPGTPASLALLGAFGLAWLADRCGSALVIGAFAAGLLVVSIPEAHKIERGVTELGHFFIPLFFVTVGASVNLRALDPLKPDGRFALAIGVVLIAVGVAGKLAAGYAPFWFRGRKAVIGVGMIPRGEVGVIFAQMGLAAGVFDAGFFGAITLMVMVTTLLAPPLLKRLLGARDLLEPERPEAHEGLEELVSEA
jgi:Kef-type K+ transport system membrane component KefB